MDKTNIVAFTFGAVNRLERFTTKASELLRHNQDRESKLNCPFSDQVRVVKQMRQVANKLQLELAKNNWVEAIRLMKIFYGLDNLIRPELMESVVKLSNCPERKSKELQATVH